MPTRTFTREQAMALTLPGDLPGLLRKGSPVSITLNAPAVPGDDPADEFAADGVILRATADAHGDVDTTGFYDDERLERGNYYGSSVRLRLADRTGLFHAIDWLAEGEKVACRPCRGTGHIDDCLADHRPCPPCNATGTIGGAPAHLWWTLRREADPAVAVVAVWLCVQRVRDGHDPIPECPAISSPSTAGIRYVLDLDDTPLRDVVNLAHELSRGCIVLDGTGDGLTITVEVPE